MNIDQRVLILLGLGMAGVMATAAAYQDYNDYEEEVDEMNENYYDTGVSNNTIINYDLPVKKQADVSPLEFGSMVGKKPLKEQYVASDYVHIDANDYIHLDDYTKNPDKIKVYNPSNDTVGLPIGDMTDVGAAESNKYIYDRTIGTIGFTSTKIGARQRDGADKIRGDLPIIPDKTGWFQTSADPSTALLLGAMNVSNGIADVTQPTTIQVQPPTQSGVAGASNALRSQQGTYSTLDDLREQAQGVSGVPGRAFMARRAPSDSTPERGLSVAAIQHAAINQRIRENETLGENTLYIK